MDSTKGESISKLVKVCFFMLFLTRKVQSVACDFTAPVGCVDCEAADDTQCSACNTNMHYVFDATNKICLADSPDYVLNEQGIPISYCPPPGVAQKNTNLIVNGDFETGSSGSGWSYDTDI